MTAQASTQIFQKLRHLRKGQRSLALTFTETQDLFKPGCLAASQLRGQGRGEGYY